MRQFYVAYPEILQSAIEESGPADSAADIFQSPIEECRPTVNPSEIRQSVIGRSGPPAAPAEIIQTVTKQSPWDVLKTLRRLANVFPLSWTHYTRLLRVENPLARKFYESESLRGGWTVRQLDRHIATQFYERAALSRNKVAMLRKGENPPVGLILCTERGESLARYALEGLPNKMVVREYKTALPSEKRLAAELARARKALELSSLDSRWLRGRTIRRDERAAVARTRLGRIRTEITHRGTS